MSRLTDLIARARAKDPELADDLEAEIRALSSRRAFGLNFERHQPEAVELPQRPARRGDKVRVLPDRGSAERGDQRLWRVARVEQPDGKRLLHLVLPADESECLVVSADDVVVVAEFRDPIYPGLVSTGRVDRGGDRPVHTVINGENFHTLKALTFTHRGKVDAIYIDPPYNTGAKDWKYNNNYVEGDDHYRHSKWLAFMERRLRLARDLLNPEGSVLVVTIDEKEYLRLGLLLEQTFPEATIQMVSTLVNPTGAIRADEFTRVNEFIYCLRFGAAQVAPEVVDVSEGDQVRWNSLRRFEMSSRRNGPQPRPDQFYPIFVDRDSGRIVEVGDSIPVGVPRSTVADRVGCSTVWPLKPDGTEMIWGLTPSSLRERLAQGYVKVARAREGGSADFSIYYLTSGKLRAIERGEISIVGRAPDGSVLIERQAGVKKVMPLTQWSRESHNAQSYGTKLLARLLPGRRFPFPKSLYAVEDVLRFFVAEKPDAVVLDFFAGSGTTAHAVMRLNRQDGGRRRSISVTNNEVSADEQRSLKARSLRPGDPEWEQWGICDYITKPRLKAAITGLTPSGEQARGEYRFADEFPLSDGFAENAEFFTLTYETPVSVGHNRSFERIAPLLWLRAGALGRRIEAIPDRGWDVADSYGILFDLDVAADYCEAIRGARDASLAYVVTDDDRRFQSVVRRLPEGVEAVRLYESYLQNFRFVNGD